MTLDDVVAGLQSINQHYAQQFSHLNERLEQLATPRTAPIIEDQDDDLFADETKEDKARRKAEAQRQMALMQRQTSTEDQLDQLKFEKYVGKVGPSEEAMNLASQILAQERKAGRNVSRESALRYAMGVIIEQGGNPKAPPPQARVESGSDDFEELERPGRRSAVGGTVDPRSVPTDQQELDKLANLIDKAGPW